MHPYATDSQERLHILFLLAALSILVAWLFGQLITAAQITIPWWVDAPSVMGLYGIFYLLFNQFLWRFSFWRKIGLVKVPSFEGQWTGFLVSNYDSHETRHNVLVHIQQHWTNLCLTFETESSKSHSVVAAILTQDPFGKVLVYEYMNEPRSDAKFTMHTHRGTARLRYRSENRRELLEGEYYTGRDRQTHGTLQLEKINTP